MMGGGIDICFGQVLGRLVSELVLELVLVLVKAQTPPPPLPELLVAREMARETWH